MANEPTTTEPTTTESLLMNSSFSKILPTLQLAIDSTSLGEFKTCPRRYYYTIICGYVPPQVSVDLHFGLLYHSILEFYDHERASGKGHKDALISTVRYALNETWDHDLNRPWMSADPNKNRETLIRSIIDYLDKFSYDTLETVILKNGTAAVELSFRLELDKTAPTGEHHILCGHIDKLAKLNGYTWIVDRKTTKSTINRAYFARYSPDNQMSFYTYAGKIIYGEEIRGVILDVAQIMVDHTEFYRDTVHRSDSTLNEWIQDTLSYIDDMEESAKNNYWRQNDKACLSGATIVTVTRGSRKGWKMRLDKLYEMFNGINTHNRQIMGLDTYLLSDVGGMVRNNLVLDVISRGQREVFRIHTEETAIKATNDHEFLTEEGWKRLDELKPGDRMSFWSGRAKLKHTSSVQEGHRPYIIGLPYYEGGGWIKVEDERPYICQRRSRLVVEAELNGLDLYELVNICRTDKSKAENLSYLSSGVEVHHINGVGSDDRLENLEAIPAHEHKKKHTLSVNKLDLTIVTSIEYIGVEHVYDVAMEAPYNNFVASGLIAHNCGSVYIDPVTDEVRYGCPFRPVCGAAPEIRQMILDTEYNKRVWDPLLPREKPNV
jgi:hypothetical protein